MDQMKVKADIQNEHDNEHICIYWSELGGEQKKCKLRTQNY